MAPMRLPRAGALAIVLALSACGPAASQSFTPLGHLPGGIDSGGYALSPDGRVVVGDDYTAGGIDLSYDRSPARWTAATGGWEPLAAPTGGIFVWPPETVTGVSADGEVITGNCLSRLTFAQVDASCHAVHSFQEWVNILGQRGFPVSEENISTEADLAALPPGTPSAQVFPQPVVWTRSGGVLAPTLLPLNDAAISPSSGAYCMGEAHGVSADGTTIVGYVASFDASRPVRWSRSGGSWTLDALDGLGVLPCGSISSGGATAVASDGSVVVGEFNGAAFLWRADGTGMATLPVAGGFFEWANGVSDDGSVVVGAALGTGIPGFWEGIRWNIAGRVPGQPVSLGVAMPVSVSRDASIIVGYAVDPSTSLQTALIWRNGNTAAEEMKTVLTVDYALTVPFTELNAALAVSPDGNRIAGYGPGSGGSLFEGFLVSLGSPRAGLPGQAISGDLNGGPHVPGGVQVTFPSVTAAGTTTVNSPGSCPPPPGYSAALCIDLTTTASYTGLVEVCVNCGGLGIPPTDEPFVRLLHFEDTDGDSIADTWVDRTSSLDTAIDRICASVPNLSPFMLAVPLPVLPVAIDIKPGEHSNSIRLGSNGNVPVAILSTAEFDARTVDPLTVSLAGAGVRLRGNGTPQAAAQDVNGDGLPDLVVQVSTQALQLAAADVEAVLTGRTCGTRRIRGVDTVRVVP